MKICATICEYNPLHYGHIKHLQFIKENLRPDLTAVFLSGNFVERGEPSILDKYSRAVHAVKAGADIVFELPTVFATANAEIFALGSLKLINSLCGEKSVCFGTESNNLDNLYKVAKILIDEPKSFTDELKLQLSSGNSFARSRANALKKALPLVDENDFLKPNNILAIEYIKAILKNGYDIKVKNVVRENSDYLSKELSDKNSSALAIRTALEKGDKSAVKNSVPLFVFKDLPRALPDFSKEIIYSILNSEKYEIKGVLDCSEGLENKIKECVKTNFTLEDIVGALKTKRYTETRIKRILLAIMLGIQKDFTLKCLNSDLYLKVLAVNKDKVDALSYLSSSKYPLITRKSDATKLNGTALECFEKDLFSNSVYSANTKKKINGFEMKIV